MKRVLLTIVVVIAIAIAAVLAIAATRPDTYTVERSTTIAAAPGQVYPWVNDFHQWPQWSPWEELDPQMTRTFSGPPSGVGSSYAWKGNDKVGEGKMTITESQPDSRIGIQLDFIKPWEATSQTTFDFVPSGAGTQVAWRMNGNHNFMSKVMCVFISMDQMIGGDLESGLARLKTLAEGAAPADTTRPDTLTTGMP